MYKDLNNKKGFTLMELVVVIAIIAILALIMIPAFQSYADKARVTADSESARNMHHQLMLDYSESNKYGKDIGINKWDDPVQYLKEEFKLKDSDSIEIISENNQLYGVMYNRGAFFGNTETSLEMKRDITVKYVDVETGSEIKTTTKKDATAAEYSAIKSTSLEGYRYDNRQEGSESLTKDKEGNVVLKADFVYYYMKADRGRINVMHYDTSSKKVLEETIQYGKIGEKVKVQKGNFDCMQPDTIINPETGEWLDNGAEIKETPYTVRYNYDKAGWCGI